MDADALTTALCSAADVTMRVTPKHPTAAEMAWLSASVPPEVKQMERGAHLRRAAMARRLVSTSAFALRPTAWDDDGLPNACWYTSNMASATSGATGVVAALSK